jgi:tetratricopeptide (TPR) repeat protein
MNFARWAFSDLDSVSILFIMTIDPPISSTPFASTTSVSSYKDEENEVLFSVHTMFRISDIKQMSENKRLYRVNVSPTGDNDQDLCTLTKRIREQTFADEEGWSRLGQLLFQMSESDKAQQVYEVLLERASSDRGKASIYHHLGLTKDNQGNYTEAITFYEKVLEIDQKTLPPNHPHLQILKEKIKVVKRKCK